MQHQNTVSVTARVDKGLEADLAKIAKTTGRTRSALINEALRSFVSTEIQFISKVEAGLADLEAGRTVDMDAVVSAVRRAIRPST
jgi:predicted transcriptional regulator